jgi:hypothetical protein
VERKIVLSASTDRFTSVSVARTDGPGMTDKVSIRTSEGAEQ